MKCLKEIKSNKKRYKKLKSRFKSEIETLKKLNELNNKYVIKIIDYNISDDELFWYIMPLGRTITDFFNNENNKLNFNK